ncbi:AAA family ATPase, partial [Rhodopirellula bahusiensis]
MNDSSLPPILPEDNSGPGNPGTDNPSANPPGAPPSPPEMSAPADPASHIAVPEVATQQAPPVLPEFAKIKQLFELIQAEVAKLYVGQDELVLGTLTALFSGGHVLIESVPGLGKTLFVRTLGRILGCEFGRIQFTADLMPSD